MLDSCMKQRLRDSKKADIFAQWVGQVTKLLYNLNSDSEGDEGSDLDFSDQEEDEDGDGTGACSLNGHFRMITLTASIRRLQHK
jgi:hypothetical protein